MTGLGLATSAGLNAYIPLLAMGLLARYSDLITLPSGWNWLESPWTLGILAVLLVIEVVADKVPVVDHVNDLVQTVVRPTAGGIAFGAASSSQTVTVSDPNTFFGTHQWVPVVTGIVVSLIVHSMKAAARPVINTTTAGFGAPVASTIEDIASVLMAVAAILLPVLVLVFIIGLVYVFWALMRGRRRRGDAKRAAAAGVIPGTAYETPPPPREGTTLRLPGR